jgi:hypothetical protein
LVIGLIIHWYTVAAQVGQVIRVIRAEAPPAPAAGFNPFGVDAGIFPAHPQHSHPLAPLRLIAGDWEVLTFLVVAGALVLYLSGWLASWEPPYLTLMAAILCSAPIVVGEGPVTPAAVGGGLFGIPALIG